MLDSAANTVLTILGIGFLIFMHELGHFLAARLFKVRVETFSLGFGPRLAGWRQGDTEYRVSILPLGGYVKMAGEYGDLDDDEPLRGDDLMAKPIWQRFVIFSAGVIVNFLLAFLIFPVAFGIGVPFLTTELGSVQPGGPAWVAGLRPGDTILAVNDTPVLGFNDVALEVALSDPEQTVLRILRDGREQLVDITPVQSDGRYDIQVGPAAEDRLVVAEDGPARGAGLRDGDRLVSLGELVLGELHDGQLVTPARVLGELALAHEPVRLVVERDGQRREVTLEPELLPMEGTPRVLGAWPVTTAVGALRGQALQAGFPLQVGDGLRAVDGQPVFERELIRELLAAAPADQPSLLRIERRPEDGPVEELEVSLTPSQRRAVLDHDLAWGQDMTTDLIRIMPGGALEDAGLRTGDRLVALGEREVRDYEDLLDRMGEAEESSQVEFLVSFLRDGVERSVSVRARPRTAPHFGLQVQNAQVRHELDLAGALTAGWDASINALRTTGLTLTKLFTGEVSTKNLGGPLSISYITYKQAEWDVAKLIFFLALLSVNLGFINILPVPVLDGGQMLFLLCEKVKGSRLSESFLQNAQMAGVVAILALMAYVTYNDIVRLWW